MGDFLKAAPEPRPRPDQSLFPPPLLGKHNPGLARLRRLARREDPERTVVDGVKLLLDLVDAGVAIEEVFITPEQDAALFHHAGLGPLRATSAWHLATPDALESAAPTQHSQGVLAVVRVPRRQVEPRGIVLYLDVIQDPGNLGALVRCAAALGADGVACSPGGADPFAPRAIRGAAGQCLLFPVATEVEIGPLAADFLARGGSVAATVGAGGQDLASWRPRLPLLLVLGNEGQGLRAATLDACPDRITIPLDRGVESLNVAVTAGIVLAALGGVAVTPILRVGPKNRRTT